MSIAARIFVSKNDFQKISARFPQATEKLVNNALTNVIYRADKLTPVDTGALRANKTMQFAHGGNNQASVTWNQEYAPYIEFGTVFAPAQPFAQPAVDQMMPGYMADLAALEGQL